MKRTTRPLFSYIRKSNKCIPLIMTQRRSLFSGGYKMRYELALQYNYLQTYGLLFVFKSASASARLYQNPEALIRSKVCSYRIMITDWKTNFIASSNKKRTDTKCSP